MLKFERARQNMVDGQIRPASVTDWRIIDAMRALPREAFVPDSKRELVYLDLDLEIDGGDGRKHFLLNPIMTARLIQAAEIQRDDRVLVVGCPTGYVAAVVAKLADRVVTTIDDETLAQRMRATLPALGFANVDVRVAEAARGDLHGAPFDAILLCGAAEVEPTALYEQLKLGGRLVGAFATGRPQRVTVVTRSHCDFGTRILFDASVPVLPGLERVPAFEF
ncbi:protein-L-isoaspartate(D-aspartate) O-methyltransferase [Rhodopseudomonas thermotolerans]|uniref:Protein-L-isoaspartate O-methyltransferase n=2 Tax=Rhodopseudomonas TaxID=1073 RepID=A0A336JX58_9BRAD|nr:MULTISPECIES: protein-L-isoaspartate O-methyltransferase [Rhodopseudomonas]RED27598.1 protein-L-isoaspartate(D-aspartate) O-methyltransferase [Rhodopseudomonas pentothenatexigens]REF91136.1 protein-L-isoaspartate(D-aspartate) O-methyltransferase [Rhodopseudomonas thermotolerans]SSW92869.1 protein-L-isoaspartate(D-aspartate) O-methyltransferase [Rhodopseudomonas pentothenatexigens]